MKVRAITGFFLVAIVLGAILLGAYSFTTFILIVSILAIDEFYHLVRTNTTIRPQKIGGIILATGIYLALYQYLFKDETPKYLLIAVPLAIAIIIAELYRKSQNPFHNIAYTFLGVLFFAVPFYFFYALAFIGNTYNMHYPLGFLILLWSSDTGAYLVGSYFAKHQLFERHSPKKSWEGFAGGMFSSLLAAWLVSLYFKELSGPQWLIVSLIIVIIGTFGDLAESMLKRSFFVKDSSFILPGHGGLLDRFDGLLLAAPLVFVYLQLI